MGKRESARSFHIAPGLVAVLYRKKSRNTCATAAKMKTTAAARKRPFRLREGAAKNIAAPARTYAGIHPGLAYSCERLHFLSAIW